MTLLLLLTLGAEARELSLLEALGAVDDNRDLQRTVLDEDSARAQVQGASASFDPTLTADASASGQDSSGFIAGYAVDSSSSSLDASSRLQGSTPTGTTWSVGASLANAHTLTLSTFSDGVTEQERNIWAGLVDLQLSQDLLAPFRRQDEAIALRQAREQLAIAELNSVAARSQAAVDIAEAWWTWASAVDAASVAEAALEEARELEALTAAWHEEGDVAKLEVDRVRAARIGAEQTLSEARLTVRTTADSLLLAMGERPGQELEPEGEGFVGGGPVNLDHSLARALAQNLDLLVLRAEVDAATQGVRDARGQLLPELNASGSLGMGSLAESASGALTQLVTDGLPQWSAGLELTVPLGNRAARAEREQARASEAQSQLDVLQAEDRVQAEVYAAVGGVEQARRAVELSRQLLAVAEETEAGERARVEEGVSRLDDLLAARTARLEAAGDVLAAERDRALAELELLRVEGRLGGIDAL